MLLRAAVAVLVPCALALAQNSTGSNGNPNPPGGANSGSNSSNSGDAARAMRALLRGGSGDSFHSGPNEAILGRVLLNDGGEARPGILVQRVCGTSVMAEARTASDGRFVLARSANKSLDPEASAQDGAAGTLGCEIRASLSGYMTASVPAGNGRSDGGEVLILLHGMTGLQDMTVSATNLLAPKDARKAYEKGLDAERRHSPDQAQQAFLNAVKIYPRYAAAWLELGKVYEQRDHRAEARDAYTRSAAADAAYLFPYEQLYRLDLRESRWQEAADTSTKVLRLDPYEFPQAYYANALANLQLNRLDEAERSARETVKLEGAQAEPRGNYVLGVVLWRKGDLSGAEEKIQAFLSTSTAGVDQANAQRALAAIQQQQVRRRAREEAARPTGIQISSPGDAPRDR